MSRFRMLWLLLALLLAVEKPTAAQPRQGQSEAEAFDVIIQRDGVLLRGRVAELRPGEQVTLVLLSGETRVIKWTQIQRATGPSFVDTELAPQPPRDERVSPERAPAAAALGQGAPAPLTAPRILWPTDGEVVRESNLELRVALPPGSGEVGLRVLVNGKPAADQRGLVLKTEGIEKRLRVPLAPGQSTISVRCVAPAGEGPESVIRVRQEASTDALPKPRLYVLAVGVGHYRQSDLRLRYPAKDASDLGAVLKLQEGRFYQSVETRVITDELATRDAVLEGLDWLQKQTTARDVAMIFMAGHGINDASSGTYYWLPYDADLMAMNRTLISQQELQRTLRSVAGKVLFFLDTCHAGAVMSGDRSRGIADMSQLLAELSAADNGLVVFAAATGRQESQESPRWENGAFTRALVEGLRGQAAYQNGRPITVSMLEVYISERVKELTGGTQTPTTTKPGSLPDFPVAVGERSAAPAPLREALPPIKHGPFVAGLQLGPMVGVNNGGTWFSLAAELGVALDRRQNLYLIMTPQVQLGTGFEIWLPVGLTWDIQMPFLRGLYVSPSVQLGYRVYNYVPIPDTGSPAGPFGIGYAHTGVFLPELGVKYVLRSYLGRFYIAAEPLSFPVFFGGKPPGIVTDRNGAKQPGLYSYDNDVTYRLMIHAGVHFGTPRTARRREPDAESKPAPKDGQENNTPTNREQPVLSQGQPLPLPNTPRPPPPK